MDVQSLYTSIPHQDGLKALGFFLEKRPEPAPSTTTLHGLAKLILTLNNFSHFLQIKGMAMGTHSLFQSYSSQYPQLFLCLYRDRSFWDTLVHSFSTPNASPHLHRTFPSSRRRHNTCLFTSFLLTIHGRRHTFQLHKTLLQFQLLEDAQRLDAKVLGTSKVPDIRAIIGPWDPTHLNRQ
eukprot:g39354.t1